MAGAGYVLICAGVLTVPVAAHSVKEIPLGIVQGYAPKKRHCGGYIPVVDECADAGELRGILPGI